MSLGISQPWRTRWGVYTLLAGVLATAGALFLHDLARPCTVELKGLATPLITVSALVLAYHQWRHLRNEVSMAGSLQRLDVVNSFFLDEGDRKSISQLFGERATWDEGIGDAEEWKRRMYVFMELDNLQYGLEKFRLGYSSAFQALRVVDVFAARCKSPSFLQMARQLVRDDAGSYTRETRTVVASLREDLRFSDLL